MTQMALLRLLENKQREQRRQRRQLLLWAPPRSMTTTDGRRSVVMQILDVPVLPQSASEAHHWILILLQLLVHLRLLDTLASFSPRLNAGPRSRSLCGKEQLRGKLRPLKLKQVAPRSDSSLRLTVRRLQIAHVARPQTTPLRMLRRHQLPACTASTQELSAVCMAV